MSPSQEAEVLEAVARFNLFKSNTSTVFDNYNQGIVTPACYNPVEPTIKLSGKMDHDHDVISYYEIKGLRFKDLIANAKNCGVEISSISFTWCSENISVKTLVYVENGEILSDKDSPFIVKYNNKLVREFYEKNALAELKESFNLPNEFIKQVKQHIKTLRAQA